MNVGVYEELQELDALLTSGLIHIHGLDSCVDVVLRGLLHQSAHIRCLGVVADAPYNSYSDAYADSAALDAVVITHLVDVSIYIVYLGDEAAVAVSAHNPIALSLFVCSICVKHKYW